MTLSSSPHVLVTGATGFIGAHVVDVLLSKGLKVRGTTRNLRKAEAMKQARPKYADKLEFVQTGDLESPGVFDEAVKGIDAVIHVASPLKYDVKDNEKELIIPSINGTRSILDAAAAQPSIKRLVLTSSYAAVLNADRKAPPYFTYTGQDWNPLSYEEAASPSGTAVIAYRGAKKYAELAAWDFVRDHKPAFDLVTLCPPMCFGPVVHPVDSVSDLNESNSMFWKVASGLKPLPVARVPFWIDVRDLAEAHVEALLRPEAGGKRYIPASPERFSYALAADTIRDEFDWAKDTVAKEEHTIDESHGVDGETAARELGLHYKPFKQTVVDFVSQAIEIKRRSGAS